MITASDILVPCMWPLACAAGPNIALHFVTGSCGEPERAGFTVRVTVSQVCPVGRYSASGSPPCSPCTPPQGHRCPPGSTTSTGVPLLTPCPAGSFRSDNGCVLCPAGRYGFKSGLTSRNCSGPCAVASGYGCAEGSTYATGKACPAGKFSAGGGVDCAACPLHTYSWPEMSECFFTAYYLDRSDRQRVGQGSLLQLESRMQCDALLCSYC